MADKLDFSGAASKCRHGNGNDRGWLTRDWWAWWLIVPRVRDTTMKMFFYFSCDDNFSRNIKEAYFDLRSCRAVCERMWWLFFSYAFVGAVAAAVVVFNFMPGEISMQIHAQTNEIRGRPHSLWIVCCSLFYQQTQREVSMHIISMNIQ